MKKFLTVLLIVYCSLFIVPISFAGYVLPYPSYMPGNKLYKISRLADTLKSYWYFGDIAKTKYHLGLSDKYLVEAKTLFEYQQYLLAIDALKRSNDNFKLLPQFLKNDTQRKTISEASDEHIRILDGVGKKLPEEFLWRPEKGEESMLQIGLLLKESNGIRLAVKDYVAH